jgi:SAM-dependent methyltransferase
MSEDRRAAQAPKPLEGAAGPLPGGSPTPTVPELGSTPSSTTQIAAEIVEAQAAALDAEARSVPPVAPAGGSADAAAPPARVRGDSSPGGRRRGRMGLRIPDDEVSRPQVASREVRTDPPPPTSSQARSAPMPAATPSELRPIGSAPPPPPQAANAGPLTPMRIITINPPAPAPSESRPPPRPAASARPAPPASAPPPPRVVQEDSWTPFQPAVADDAVPVDSQPSVDSGPVSQPRHAFSSEEMIPIETEALTHSDSQPESIEPLEDVEEAAPRRPVLSPPPPPPVRPPAHAILPTDDDGGDDQDVNFEDDAPTPSAPRVQAHTRPDGVAAQQHQARAGVPSEAEIAPEDLVSVESAPGARLQTPPPVIAPPMRARIASQPPVPPPKANKPPLVIVPPHVGYVPAAPSEPSGLRRKGRLWWEDLFNDDYLRTVEKLSDEQIAREADFIEDSLGIERGGALLDLGCGTGRHAIELARRGYEMVGFDLSLAMLARAGDEAQERSAKLNFVQGDMRDMTFEEQFDGIYCWNTTFGYFEEDKNAQVVEHIRRALKLGGLFLLDVVNRDFIMRQSPSLAWFEGDGCVCMDEMNIDFITSRMRVKRTMMLDDGRSREIEYSMRVYSLHELGKVLHDHGFKVCEVSGRLGTPGVFFGNESPRTIILAEKR